MKEVMIAERLELNCNIFEANGRNSIRHISDFFGREYYEIFRRAGKSGVDIPEEVKQAVDRAVNDKTGEMYGVQWGGGLWIAAMLRANETVKYAHDVLFSRDDRSASLTTNIAWSTNRPSAALEILTKPTRLIGEQCRAEQFRQLTLAVLCAEEIVAGRDNARVRLTKMNDFLEKQFFVGKSGDPKQFHTFSYHTPGTNKLVGLSSQYPDPRFAKELWVKSLYYPVRSIGIKDSEGNLVGTVQALYDQREKGFGEKIIKGLYKSKKDSLSNGKLEVVRHVEDSLGFRLVIMEGGHPMRDMVTGYLDSKLQQLFGAENIRIEDSVDPDNGCADRFSCRRRKIYEAGSSTSMLEVIVQSIEDYISQEYEIGRFDCNLGMHDGPGHPLYELKKIAKVAKDIWPPSAFQNLDVVGAKRNASYAKASELARAQRIYPSPYESLE